MLSLNTLEKVSKKRKRVGRGGARGGTSGSGHKGQKARSGGGVKAFFEGGQMPLSRRLPRRGFVNAFKADVRIVDLNVLEKHFSAGTVVTRQLLQEKGFLKGKKRQFLVKVLGSGSLSKAVTVQADLFSKTARDAIEKAGGKVEVA